MVNPPETSEPSLRQCRVVCALIDTLAGPLVPEYRVSAMVTQSNRDSVLKYCALTIIPTTARTVQRSSLP
jgi:hypothetical protein